MQTLGYLDRSQSRNSNPGSACVPETGDIALSYPTTIHDKATLDFPDETLCFVCGTSNQLIWRIAAKTKKVLNMARPKIVIGKTDHSKLLQLANGLLDRKPELAEELIGELERAKVAADGATPENTVQMGTTVEYSTDDGQNRKVTLVYPGDADIAQGKISILTPIGTALLGLAVKQTIDFVANDGRELRLTVTSVEKN